MATHRCNIVPAFLAGLVLAGLLLSGCGSTTTATYRNPAPPTPSPPALRGQNLPTAVAPEKPVPPVVNPAAFKDQGDLAFVSGGLLYNLDGGTGEVRQLTKSGQAFCPAWSYDGKWLAYIQVSNSQALSGQLWLVRPDGTEVHQVQGLPGPVSGGDFAWSPAADVLAVRGENGIWAVAVDSPPRQVVSAEHPSFAWSPDGRFLAFNVTLPWAERASTTDWANRTDAIYTVGAGGGRPVRQVVAPDKGMIEVAAWWPDGKGLLYWLAPIHGVSIKADGLDLWSLPLGDGTPRLLTHCLVRKGWLCFSPRGGLLTVKGYSRFPWESKELAVADVESGRVRTIGNPAGDVAFDPAWSPDGRCIALVAARDMASVRVSGARAVQDWTATKTLWLENSDGSGAHPVSAAGSGVSQPAWSKDGNNILYARGYALWLIGADGGVAQRIIAASSSGPAGNTGFCSYPNLANYAWFQPA
ncbi:MAG TPA: biopolymer transporter Tol [Spirochaetia bacterium]|nr:biopolymer transporter Tol [Spirochaetia bacterium]